MYGQTFSSPITSAAKWIFFGFAGIVLMAILLGANIKDATWLNPKIAAAEANRLNIDAQHQQAMYQLEEQLSTAKTEAEIKEIHRQQALLDAQYQHDILMLSQDVTHQDLAFRTWMTVFTIIGGTFAVTLFMSTTIWVGSRAWVYVQSMPRKEIPMPKFIPPIEKKISTREAYDPLGQKEILYKNRLDERLQQIVAERKHRDDEELLTARMKALLDAAIISSEVYEKRPLAD